MPAIFVNVYVNYYCVSEYTCLFLNIKIKKSSVHGSKKLRAWRKQTKSPKIKGHQTLFFVNPTRTLNPKITGDLDILNSCGSFKILKIC